ncbi:hypothetical protein GCM10023075_80690 [Streptosporangium album]
MTAQPRRTGPASTPTWESSVGLAHYDRRGLLTEAEAEALQTFSIDRLRHDGLSLDAVPLRPVARLVRPLADALAGLYLPPDDRHQRRFARDAAGLVLVRCGELRRAF